MPRRAEVAKPGWLHLLIPYHRSTHGRLLALGAKWVSSKSCYRVKDMKRVRDALVQMKFTFEGR